MSCHHTLADKESACNDGLCPFCSVHEATRLRAALELIRDYTYTDAEGPELRAQNMRNHMAAKRALEGEGQR